MTLDETLAHLQCQKAEKYCKEHHIPLDKYRGSPLHDPEWRKERQDRIAKMSQCSTPEELEEYRRHDKHDDLKTVDFVEHMIILPRQIIFYLAQSETDAKRIDDQLTRLVEQNPQANLYSYEQPLCFFITRLDKQPQSKKSFGFRPVGEDW